MFFRLMHHDYYRKALYVAIFICFLLPTFFLGAYLTALIPLAKSWKFFSWLFLWGVGGTLALSFLVKYWEELMRSGVSELVSVKVRQIQDHSQGEQLQEQEVNDQRHKISAMEKQSIDDRNIIARLQKEVDASRHRQQENEQQQQQLQQRLQSLQGEYSVAHQKLEEQREHYQKNLQDYQHTIAEQRGVIEKKQQYIRKLEGKVRDLTYEVRTLLQMGQEEQVVRPETTREGDDAPHPVMEVFQDQDSQHDDTSKFYNQLPMSSDSEVRSPYDAAILLRRCIEKAEKMLSSRHLSNQRGRYLSISPEEYTLDLRRLFDSYRTESSSVIVIFSPEDNGLIFSNNAIRGLLGWGAERFVKDFFQLIQEGGDVWYQAVLNLQNAAGVEAKKGQQIQLLMKSKSGEDILVRALLGMISEGAFAGRIVAVLYQ
ncbi:MAG: hypothetical protein ACQEP8_03860 [Chlamydiota bacterium]